MKGTDRGRDRVSVGVRDRGRESERQCERGRATEREGRGKVRVSDSVRAGVRARGAE